MIKVTLPLLAKQKKLLYMAQQLKVIFWRYALAGDDLVPVCIQLDEYK